MLKKLLEVLGFGRKRVQEKRKGFVHCEFRKSAKRIQEPPKREDIEIQSIYFWDL